MKRCKRCHQQYEEVDSAGSDPATELAMMFLMATSTDEVRENNLCPECREEMGVFNLLGFGQ
jgi:hypothetical protein